MLCWERAQPPCAALAASVPNLRCPPFPPTCASQPGGFTHLEGGSEGHGATGGKHDLFFPPVTGRCWLFLTACVRGLFGFFSSQGFACSFGTGDRWELVVFQVKERTLFAEHACCYTRPWQKLAIPSAGLTMPPHFPY